MKTLLKVGALVGATALLIPSAAYAAKPYPKPSPAGTHKSAPATSHRAEFVVTGTVKTPGASPVVMLKTFRTKDKAAALALKGKDVTVTLAAKGVVKRNGVLSTTGLAVLMANDHVTLTISSFNKTALTVVATKVVATA